MSAPAVTRTKWNTLPIHSPDEQDLQSRFHRALTQGRHDEAESLLGEGAQIGPAICIASLKMQQQDKIRAFQFLQAHGLDLDLIDEDGRTPLHHAARHGELDTLRWFLQQGLDLTKQDIWGYSALHEIVDCPHLGQEAIEAWVAAGGGLDAVTGHNETALTLACKKCRYEKARSLFDHHAAVGIQDDHGYSEFSYALRKGVPNEHPGPYGQLNVAEFNQLALDMIERMENPDILVAPGQTPLLHVVRSKRVNDREHQINLNPHLVALIDKEARITDVDQLGDSIFHIAAKRGDEQFFQYFPWNDLIESNGAVDWEAQNNQGETAEQIAADRGHQGIVDILAEQRAQSASASIAGSSRNPTGWQASGFAKKATDGAGRGE